MCKSNLEQVFTPKLTCSGYFNIVDHSGSLDHVHLSPTLFLSLTGFSSAEELKKLNPEELKNLLSQKFTWRRVRLDLSVKRDFKRGLVAFAKNGDFPVQWHDTIESMRAELKRL